MPKLTLRAARDLQSSFNGLITSSHEAHAEFPGKPTVLIPESVEDVERAVRLVQAANRRAFVRSGRGVSARDVTKPPAIARRAKAAVRKPADAIVSLEAFRDIDVGDGLVTVGAAATTGDVARKLGDTSLFLPLDDNRTQSVVSAVLSRRASPFLRSGAGSGPLRNAVVEAEVVQTKGAGAGRARIVRNKALRDVLAGGRPAVITKLVLDADAAKTDESDRWMRAWTAAYERKTFAALCDALFAAGAPKVPERVDLSVRVTSAAYSMTIVIVRATGHGDDAKGVEAVVQAAFEKAALRVIESRQVAGPGSSVAMWVTTGPGEAAPGEIVARFGSNARPRPFAKFRRAFLEAVDVAIGINPRTGRERTPRVRAWAELQLAPRGGVIASAEISDADADAKVAKEARDRMAKAIPADKASRRVTVSSSLAPTPGFDLVSSNCGDNIIPGFKGCVFQKSDGPSYAKAIQQYATSSFPPAVVQARMTPRYVAVPEDATDVTLAVTFAAQQGFKVVTRSGGHQYCGMSSGGSDTLLLDMRLFHQVKFLPAPKPGGRKQAIVGPGVALKDGSTQLRDHGVAIPHGECPLVNLGGHVQTGGLGHEVRSLGATLDWIRSFKMVTRDPQSPPGTDVYKEREFIRPAPGGSTAAPTDADVFRAVLGGGPSSFGVVTEYCFDLVADGEYPSSAGYSYPYLYLFGETKEGFRTAMEQLRQWADLQSTGQLPQGVDLFLTILSCDFPRPAALLVETMCRDKANLPDITAVVDAIDAAVPEWIRLAAHLLAPVKGPTKLSVIADEGVRKIGITGLPKSGREFDLPYKKSTHCTMTPFKTEFCDAFVELVNDVNNADGVKVVFQGGVGGGEFSANAQKKTTHMQRRNTLALIVFDVFYEDGYESQAEGFQKRMKDLLAKFSGGADVRMLWGSFEGQGTNGAQLDMSLPATQALYYDSGVEYARLQQIKKYTDPNDLFHTSFNVQKPS